MLSEKTEEGMGDVMTPEQRHKCMARIRSKNTKPEIMVRKYLFARGFRYRKNVRRLPGTPDIVLRKYRTVIFVNGCFWHGHEGCRYSHLPKSNVEFWRNKIERNKKRDLRERVELRRMGWHVIQVWECQLKPKEREMTLRSIEQALYEIYLQDRALRKPYAYPAADAPACAAEPETEYGRK